MDKIAEIREVVGDTKRMKGQQVVYLGVKDVEFLLSELERKDEEMQKLKEGYYGIPLIKAMSEENRKLREERDQWQKHAADFEEMYKSEHRDKNKQLQSAQQEIERLKKQDADVIINYALERQKLIEGLRVMTDSDDEWYVGRIPMQEFARKLYREIGVTVE